ncbi:MAG: Hpt domain-containing protein, partial [Acidobacteriaceae bacterium]
MGTSTVRGGCGVKEIVTGKGNNPEAFRAAFREEAREILADLEASLLELNQRPGDAELVGRVFRALHTLKGSGAMFGFDDLAAFTHNLENAFDEVRKGRLAVTVELVDLALSALDQIRAMVETRAGDAAVDPDLCAKILERVSRVTRGAEPQDECATAATLASQEPGDRTERGNNMLETPQRRWRIAFAPGPELMRRGADPLLLLRELRQMGVLEARAHIEDLPSLDEMDPVRCYARWEMTLTTAESADAIRDVFIFVEDACDLTIERAKDTAAEAAQLEPPALNSLP